MASSNKVSSHKPAKYTGLRLGWFFDFLRMRQISLEEAATYISYTRPTLHHWKLVDDASVSLVEKIIEAAGYHLEIKIWRGDDFDEIDTITKREMRYILPRQNVPERMAPLAAAMILYDFPIQKIASELHVNKTTVRYWFLEDDISFARLFEVVEVMGCNIHIHVVKSDAEHSGVCDDVPLFITSIDGPTSVIDICEL